MAEKEVKTKRRTLADVSKELQKSQPYTKEKIKANAKKFAKSVKAFKSQEAKDTYKNLGNVAADQWDTAKLIALVTKEEGVAAAKKLKKAIRSAATASRSQAAKDTYKDLPKHILRSPKVALTEYAPKAIKYAKNNPGTVAMEAAMFTPPGKVARGVKKIYNTAKNIRRPVPAMKKGGPVKKCKVDGIAKRGFTKAYSMKKGK